MVDDTALQAFIEKENLQEAIETTIQLVNKHFSKDMRKELSLANDEVDDTQWVSILLHTPDTMTVEEILDSEQWFVDECLEELTLREIKLIHLDYSI